MAVIVDNLDKFLFDKISGLNFTDTMESDVSLTYAVPQSRAPYRREDGMHFEVLRLGTFKKWPRWAPVMPNQLARAGFFYTGLGDKCECYSCACVVEKWLNGDDPEVRHRRLSPECDFLNGIQNGNYEKAVGVAGNAPIPRTCPEASDAPDQPVMVTGTPDFDLLSSNPHGSSSYSVPAGSSRNDSHYFHSAPLMGQQTPLSQLLPDYQDEEARRETFRTWPETAYVGPDELARAGFIYLGSTDRVQCAFCKGVLRNWAPGDNAFSEHQKHFPQCPFVRNPAAASRVQSRSTASATGGSSNNYSRALEELGVVTEMPKHHDFALESVRLATFANWPKTVPQKPDELAKAGFFYIGQDDSVKCFWCDGGLRNWDKNDDPWKEHARWFPKCSHVKHVKGSQFIEDAQKRKPAPGSSELKPIDQREVTSRMDTAVVQRVLNMGFDRTLVRDIIEYRLRTKGDDFSSAEELLETVLLYTENPPANFPLRSSSSSSLTSVPQASAQQPAGAQPSAATAQQGKSAPGTEDQSSESASKKAKKKKKNKSKGAEDKSEDNNKNTDENKNLECKVCMDNEVNIVFLPCGHLVCCSNCAPALKNCPICRGLIRGTVNAFLS